MAYIWQRWIAKELRAAGLEVIEHAGWKNRGRPASTGHFNPRGASTAHHTGVTSSSSNPAPGLQTLIHGRSDLPGPLCHVATDYRGRVHVIAAGRANHAGRIGKGGTYLMPLGGDGNAHALGNEVITNGTQKMPKVQRDATATVHAVFSKHFNETERAVHRHQDISSTGKWDLGGITTAQLRKEVKVALSRISTPSQADLIAALIAARKAVNAAAVASRKARRAVNKAAVEARKVGRGTMAANLVKRRKWLNQQANQLVRRRKWIQGRVKLVRKK